MAAASPDRILLAVALRLTSVALFASMNALIKLCEAGGARFGEIIFFRQFGAACLMMVVLASGPGFASVKTGRFSALTMPVVTVPSSPSGEPMATTS